MVERLGRGVPISRLGDPMLAVAGGILLAVFILAMLRHIGKIALVLLLLALIGALAHQ